MSAGYFSDALPFDIRPMVQVQPRWRNRNRRPVLRAISILRSVLSLTIFLQPRSPSKLQSFTTSSGTNNSPGSIE